jgi:hypothetical protein
VPSAGVVDGPDTAAIDELVAALLARPHAVVPGANVSGTLALGDTATPQVTHLPGAGAGVTLEPGASIAGAGILIVDGGVTTYADVDFVGLVIVRGPLVDRGSLRLLGSVWTTGLNLTVQGTAIASFSREALTYATFAGAGAVCTAYACADGPWTDGRACDDGDPCTAADVCAAGACGGAPVDCGACMQCDAASGCVAAPATGYAQLVAPGASRLGLRFGPIRQSSQLAWRWKSGAASVVSDFGDPAGATDYALCVTGGSSPTTVLARATIPSGTCGPSCGWTASGRGFRFRDPSASAGLARIDLAAGRRTSLRIAGGGDALELPAELGGLSAPITVQLRASGGACWEASYSIFGLNGVGDHVSARSSAH